MSTRYRKVIIPVVVLAVLVSLYIIFVPPGLLIRLSLAGRGLSPPIIELNSPVEPPEGPVINFPDPHLEAAVRRALGGLERDIHRSDLERFIGFRVFLPPFTTWERIFGFCPRPGRVSNLTGLEYAINLERLWIYRNQIRDISPLSNLINLRELNLSGNRITDITPLANLINLRELRLSGNRIRDISPLSNLHNLSKVYLSRNQIEDISPFSNLTNLEVLGLDGNQIRDISPLTNLTSLEILELDGNQISDISPLLQNKRLVDEPEKVVGVWLADNPLNADSINIYIPQLQRRGVRVIVER